MGKICCFAGHRDTFTDKELYEQLKSVCEELITEKDVLEFLVGNYGAFDNMATIVINSLKEKYPVVKLILVIPYLKSDICCNKKIEESYDEVLLADIPESTPNKYKILKCNEYMIKKSDYLVCYITRSWGGAYKTLEKARKRKTMFIYNLGNNTI